MSASPPIPADAAPRAGALGPLRARLARASEALSRQRHLLAVRDGVLAALPLLLVGSVFLLVAQPPHPALARAVEPYVPVLAVPTRMLGGLVSIYVCFATAYALAKGYAADPARRVPVDPLAAGVVATATYLTALRPTPLAVEPGAPAAWGVAAERLGPGGLFGALVLAILSVELTRVFVGRRWTIRLPAAVPEPVYRSFQALLPAAACVGLVWLFVHVFGIDVVGLAGAAARPLVRAGNTLPLVLVVVLIDSGLWFLGIHPMSALAALKPVWAAMVTQNMQAALAGEPLPNLATREFFLWFVWQGGSGGTLALVLVLLGVARSVTLKSVTRLAIVPSLFNINEPVLFGAPVVLNARLAVPFVAAPVVTATVAWLAMSFDWVARPRLEVLWTLPAPVGAFLCTGGDWRAVALQLLNLAIAAAIYWPYLRRYDGDLVSRERASPAGAGAPPAGAA